MRITKAHGALPISHHGLIDRLLDEPASGEARAIRLTFACQQPQRHVFEIEANCRRKTRMTIGYEKGVVDILRVERMDFQEARLGTPAGDF